MSGPTIAAASLQDLTTLTRPELQKLCKDYNIKANLRTDQLVELLTKQMSTTDLGPTRPTSTEPRSRMPISSSMGKASSKLRRSLSQPTLAGGSTEVGSHARTASKETNIAVSKPTQQPSTIATRRPAAATTSTIHARNPSTKMGKENGVTAVTSTTTRATKVAGPASTVSRGIAGRIAVFGRAMGKSAAEPLAPGATNVSKDAPVTLRKTTTRSIPQRSTTTLVEPEASRPRSITPANDAQAQVNETVQTDIAALQKASADSNAAMEALRAEFKAFETLLASKDSEIRRLQEQLDESRQAAENHAAANVELQGTVDDLTQRVDELETSVQERKEEADAMESRASESEASMKVRLAELEATLATVSQQIARSAEGQRSVQPSPSPFGLPVSSEGSPFLEYPRYLDLQLTPSSRRRGQFRPELLGHDALSRYDGFGRNLVEDSPRPFA